MLAMEIVITSLINSLGINNKEILFFFFRIIMNQILPI